MDISEEAVKRIEAEVVQGARFLIKRNVHHDWSQALADAAEAVVPPGWEWRINKFIGATNEDATFNLTCYNG